MRFKSTVISVASILILMITFALIGCDENYTIRTHPPLDKRIKNVENEIERLNLEEHKDGNSNISSPNSENRCPGSSPSKTNILRK